MVLSKGRAARMGAPPTHDEPRLGFSTSEDNFLR